ncbi:preprotein translocase subunit SecG [Vibrio palustris]|uniref:Protein-export membrane protein SecG n=1 Tax=Vibrio palustris TaxID=1918946 RepID=A0A1R4B8S4_9VIBR|nr:preprotein translocase subunit SecG [Vibrio palustris]SJL85324.1 Protein-export membrane protein SecG [Vibrio palustris]
MYTALLVIYLLAAVGIIGLVLIQQGKGADMGASFGAGASNTVFGSGGSGNFLTRMTAIFALIFLVTSLVLGNYSTHKADSKWVDPAQGQTQLDSKASDNAAAAASDDTTDNQSGSDVPQ